MGNLGESIVCDYLKAKAWKILERNFYSKYGEIDIIAQDPTHTLVFCEVKTYKPDSLVSPIEAITHKKLEKIRKTALYYLSQTKQEDTPARIDALIVQEGMVVDHLKNISC